MYETVIAHDGVYGKIEASDFLSIGLNHAVTVIAEKAAKGAKKSSVPSGTKLGEHDGKTISLKSGRYGAYVTDGKTNATLPKDSDTENCDLAMALELLAKKLGTTDTKPKKTVAKKAPAKKAVAKKAVPKKTA